MTRLAKSYVKLKRLLSGTQRNYARLRAMGIEKIRKYLKNNELVAVHFDKGVGFCIRKKHTYERKLTQFLESEQFERYDSMNDSFAQKNENKKT